MCRLRATTQELREAMQATQLRYRPARPITEMRSISRRILPILVERDARAHMTQFNPITGSILLSQQLGNRQSADKAEQIRRAHVLAKNVAATGDRFESAVESVDNIDPSHDDNQKRGKDGRDDGPADEPQKDADSDRPTLDLTA